MAESGSKPKYDSLPGIDTAPDVYETPELDNDGSTIQASTAVSESEGESDDDGTGLRRAHLQPDQARDRFRPTRVDAQGVDFSDNISARQRSYRTSTRITRRRADTLGDDSGDEEREDFAAKLLRVKRETEELEREYQLRLETGDKSKIEERDPREMMEWISDKVDYIYAMRRGGARGAEAVLERSVKKFSNYPAFEPSKRITEALGSMPPLPGTQIQKSQLDFVVDQAAQFDKRIATLEKRLGLDGTTMPDISEKSQFPVFTMLHLMDRRIATMADATSGKLEGVSQQVRKLLAEAEQLQELRDEATTAVSNPESPSPYTADQEAKINALYSTLPTLEKLAPALPMTLEHLRTLRFVHTSAFEAEQVLTELERRQAKQEDEIAKWEKSLQNVERDMESREKGLQGNMKVVGEWVRRLEERVARLPGAHPPTEGMAGLSLGE